LTLADQSLAAPPNWHSACDSVHQSIDCGGDCMVRKIVTAAAALLLTATVSAAATVQTDGRKNLQVLRDVANSVQRYTQFTIYDNVNAGVKDGVVTLTGKVTMPYKRDEIAKRVAKIDGVREVRDQISVLPVSTFDDQLRYRIARAIYRNSNFWNYAIM